MQRFKNILVLADGGNGQKNAIEHAAQLAKSNRASLTLIDVLESGSMIVPTGDMQKSVTALQEDLIRLRSVELEELAATVKEQHDGIDVTSSVEVGQAAIEVIRQVLRNKHDLVIKSADGQVSRFHVLFGSTELKLLRKCPCPVWLITPANKRFKRILAAVDLRASLDDMASLDRLILELATSIARRNEGSLHVVHVYKLANEQMLRGHQIHSTIVDSLLAEIESASRQQLDELLKDFPDTNPTVHLVEGEPADIIPRVAREQEIDQLVLGTVGRVGVPGFVIGNTAESILNEVNCSVLAVKPVGFETPVSISGG